jgi:hypothetical protein
MDLGKKKDAVKLMDQYFKYFPDSKVQYDMYVLPYAELYFKGGETKKAVDLIEKVSQIYCQNLDYYFSFSGKNKDYYQDDIQTAFGMLKRMNSIASQNQQPKLAAKMDSLFNQRIKSYQ